LTDQIEDATAKVLSFALGKQAGAWSAVAALVLLSCGDEFVAFDAAAGGSSGMTSAGKSSDGGAGDAGNDSGGRGGDKPVAGAGKGGMASSGGSLPTTGGAAGVGGGISVGGVGVAGGGGVAPVPPIPTAGLELWLRADEGVVIESNGVATWKDASGKHRDAAQIANNYRPILVANAIADRPAVVFDGMDDYLKLPTLSASFAAGLSIFVVLQQSAVNTCEGYFEAANGLEQDDIHFGDWEKSLLFEIEENWINDRNYPVLLNEPTLAVVVQDAQSLTLVRSNNNGVGEDQVNLAPAKERAQVFIGKSLYAGCSPFTGAIGEMILYNRGVSDDELVQVEKYLQAKWACCTK
jgi:hypothetical protein